MDFSYYFRAPTIVEFSSTVGFYAVARAPLVFGCSSSCAVLLWALTPRELFFGLKPLEEEKWILLEKRRLCVVHSRAHIIVTRRHPMRLSRDPM